MCMIMLQNSCIVLSYELTWEGQQEQQDSVSQNAILSIRKITGLTFKDGLEINWNNCTSNVSTVTPNLNKLVKIPYVITDHSVWINILN